MVSCNLCSQEFKDNFNFSRHFKANHICKYCEKQFSDKDKMKSHRQHCSKREDLTNVCTHCNKQFEYKSSLKVCPQETKEFLENNHYKATMGKH